LGIGAGITLLAIGGILAFGVRDNFDAVDLTIVGWVLMLAGAIGLIMSTALRGRRRTETVIDSRIAEPGVRTVREDARGGVI
jgi:hypothetical protein